MNKILKILSILIIGFVMFSCSTPTNDSTPYVPEPSGPETPVETPSDNPVKETPETPTDNPVEETPAPNPEVQTYSITFIVGTSEQQPVADLLNSSLDCKNLKKGTEVELPTIVYETRIEKKYTLSSTESSTHKVTIHYEGDITSVVVGNKDIEIKVYVDGVDGIPK